MKCQYASLLFSVNKRPQSHRTGNTLYPLSNIKSKPLLPHYQSLQQAKVHFPGAAWKATGEMAYGVKGAEPDRQAAQIITISTTADRCQSGLGVDYVL